MLKKMMLLAGMALAVVAFAGPASASAATWVHWNGEEQETVSEITEDFTGFAKFEVTPAPGNNFGCEVHVHLSGTTGAGGAQGQVTAFEVTTETCVGEGAFGTCTLVADNSSVPWEVDVSSTDFTITNVEIENEYANCSIPPSHLVFGSITATPNNPTKINCLTISGTGVNNGTTPVTATGELCAYNEGTYGVE